MTKFAETDKTLFIGRRDDGTIYGTWTVRQWVGQEEALEANAEVQAFLHRPVLKNPESVDDLRKVLISKGLLSPTDVLIP